MRTTSLQRGPLEAPIAPVACSSPGLMTVGGMGSNTGTKISHHNITCRCNYACNFSSSSTTTTTSVS